MDIYHHPGYLKHKIKDAQWRLVQARMTYANQGDSFISPGSYKSMRSFYLMLLMKYRQAIAEGRGIYD
jgi:hypothetical protein